MRQITLSFMILISFLTILSGCRDNPPIVVEEQTEDIEKEEASLIEETIKDETIEIIEFQLKEEVIKISLADIPIIHHYLVQHKDKARAIDQMTLTPIHLSEKSLHLLTFAKTGDVASYLLIDTTEQTSTLIADQVLLERYVTLNETTLLFNFSQPITDLNINRHQLLAFNTNSLENVSIEVSSHAVTPQALQTFTWPILDMVMSEEGVIHLTLPDLLDPTIEALQKWESLSEAPTQMIDVTVES
ncbi:hypothetical protein HMI01_05460 [Halolactibacillus miurensis]|uniref:Lipoprotein n=1 Tax=Halolactibacillus miurensis TaxID=306541 RepID=A0A1I6R537_9BACI|nr:MULTISPECIES: hypothetical protein [Halolactibacillus]GEM03558.1 hypothetical protein HMI01_05460 [Halolactibacillus miurensis]SFS59734.1 hypothetical protein SAMN05421668_105130 [Halolactibacillus miurensis]